MKIKYEFADETIEIEVSEDWGAVLIELDRQEYNNDHADTRRHISLETALEDENNSWLTDNSDTELDALQNVDFARLRAAMQLLEPRQQQLIRQVYFQGKKQSDIAREEGVSKVAISNAVKRALKKLEKLLS